MSQIVVAKLIGVGAKGSLLPLQAQDLLQLSIHGPFLPFVLVRSFRSNFSKAAIRIDSSFYVINDENADFAAFHGA